MSLRRNRRAKIVATLGPASSDRDTLRSLFHAGVDVFRLNFSHGSAEDHAVRMAILREIEVETGRPIGVMADLQAARGRLRAGAGAIAARPALPPGPGPAPRQRRARLSAPPRDLRRAGARRRAAAGRRPPAPARRRLRRGQRGYPGAGGRTTVRPQGRQRAGRGAADLRAHAQDLRDLDTALALGADWIALSFVQRPEDIIEARERIGDRARIIAKLEKPSAVERLDEIIAQADALMVARGDLGVELPAEQVPAIQKRAVRCRRAGKPVIVATQMLESMIEPRAHARRGLRRGHRHLRRRGRRHAVGRIRHRQAPAGRGRDDEPHHRGHRGRSAVPPADRRIALPAVPGRRTRPRPCAARCATPPRCSRRPRSSASPVPAPPACGRRANGPRRRCSASRPAWRRATLVWGVHSVHVDDVADIAQSTRLACAVATQERFCSAGQTLAIIAGMPFGKAGTTNLLRIATA